MSVTTNAGGATAQRISSRQVGAVVLGNALEFYDFLTYSFFAVQIGRTFFPSSDPQASLLASLATFGAGFLTRPVGAVVIGRFADRVGRKPAMLLTFVLMGAAITGLALTPPYRAIGPAAPILVVLFRMTQGFALGGEVGPSTAFLMEASPPRRRGLLVSLQYMGQDSAILAAGLVGVLLARLLEPQTLTDYGWRGAFLLGALIVPFGLWLRSGLVETLHAQESAAAPGRMSFTKVAVLGLVMIAAGTIVNYVLAYLTTYATTSLKLSAGAAFGATVVLGLVGAICDPLGGWLSDRFGRRPVMLIPWAVLALTLIPAFLVMTHLRSALALYGMTALLTACVAISSSSVLVSLTESLPKAVRSGALALLYAAAVAVFGGTAQFNVAWLSGLVHSDLVPGFYAAGAAVLGLGAMLMVRETAPGVLSADGP